MQEEWKDFEFNSLKYRISSFGRIYSYASNMIIKERLDKYGYLKVTLGSKQNRTTVSVHRLVAINFVENKNPNEFIEVNHIDFNRANCNANNLEWCTHRQNIDYSIDNNRMYYQKNNVSGENNPNYGNRKLSKIYKENPELSKEKQGRPGIKNGKCIKVAMIGINNNFYKEFNYIRECANYIIKNGMFIAKEKEYIATKIGECINGRRINYSGYFFKTI
jgi:hypothetical protein